MRIGFIEISQETNDFNPLPTTLADFRSYGLFEGAEIFERLGDVGPTGGFLEAVRRSGRIVESVPIIRALAVAGGRLDREAFEFFQDRIRHGLKAAGKLDGLVLQLHGACAAEGIDDVEGEQAALCREILGRDVPITLALDHHANVTAKMIANVDAVVGHRTQPHDFFETARIAGELMFSIAAREVRPVIAWRKIPLVTHQEKFLTSGGPMKAWFDRARALEADPKVLQVSNYPMQPWLDVAEGGWSTIVVTDGDADLAERLADDMARMVWDMRGAFLEREAAPVDEALRRALAAPEGMVIVSDTGDTVFGGAAGDSNVILEAILRLGLRAPALVPMISPSAVDRLAAAGEGATLTLPLGGCAAPAFFTPLEVTGTVRRIADGSAVKVAFGHQREIDMGRVAVFETGPVTLLVSELRGVAGNLPDVWRAFGIEPADHRIIVVKTASNFQYFAPIASGIVRADTPGPGQSDVFTLPWRRLPRPIHPLDEVTDWRDAHPANRTTGRGR